MITLGLHWVYAFSYSKIVNEGIYIRKNIFDKGKYFQWSDVKTVDIDYYKKRGRGRIYAVYDYYLILKTGEEINLRNSQDFWDYDKFLYVNDFLNNKKIKFKIANINIEDLQMLVETYEHNFGTKTEILFRKLYHL